MSKGSPKKLTDLSREEMLEFFESFDRVFVDMDGVLCHLNLTDLEGAPEGLEALRTLGKQCYIITNNSVLPLQVLLQGRLKKFNITEDQFIRPATAVKWYLKSINFTKEVYIVGTKSLKDEIRNAGFKVVTEEMTSMTETGDGIEEVMKSIRPDVGAVVIDFALNVNFIMLQKCVEYITKNNALFMVGAADPLIPFRGSHIISSLYFINAVKSASGKEPEVISKPGEKLNEIIVQQLGPIDPKRVLFIGDSVTTDMAFAAKSGYQKLAPLTGFITKKDIENWSFDEAWKPDYYVDSIKDIDTVVKILGLNYPKL